MANCLNHQWAEATANCARCNQPYCDACLVDFLGQRYCGICRDYRLHEMQGPAVVNAPLAGTGTVDMGRWLNGGWALISNDLLTWCVAVLVAGLLSTVTCGVLTGPLYAGMYMLAFRKMTHGSVEVGNIFDGFRRFLNAFLLMLLILGMSIAVRVVAEAPSWVLMVAAPDQVALRLVGAAAIQIVVAFVGSAVLQGATLFAIPHVAARNVNPIEALTASWTVFRRNPVMFSVLGFVFQLIAGAGVLALCIGVFITISLMIAATAQAYADHFGVEGWDRA